MKKYEPFKRIIKYISAIIILILEMFCFWLVWINYYNPIIELPFWRRGNWLVAFVYGIMLLFFQEVYGGLKIGYFKRLNVILSQILSLACVNIVIYLQTSLLDRGFVNPIPLLSVFIIQDVIVVLWAFVFTWIYGRLYPPRRMLLIYGERPAFNLMKKINSREDKYQISGLSNINEGMEKIMANISDYDAVIIGDIPSHERNLILKYCFGRNVRTYTLPKISDIMLKNADEIHLFDTPLILARNLGLTVDQQILKRLMDILCSLVLIIIFSPVMLCVALLIKMSDGGNIIYKQKRLTLNGKIFELYKFRSMIMNAEKDGKARLSERADDRVTPIGRFIRRTRLDELPQLFNILKGEMSLVGPRPERPEIAEQYEKKIPEFSYRLKVKAGLTGYAQIYGKYNTVPYDKLKLDLTYISKYSLLLDIKLLLMTVKILFIRESTEGVDSHQVTADDEINYEEEALKGFNVRKNQMESCKRR